MDQRNKSEDLNNHTQLQSYILQRDQKHTLDKRQHLQQIVLRKLNVHK